MTSLDSFDLVHSLSYERKFLTKFISHLEDLHRKSPQYLCFENYVTGTTLWKEYSNEANIKGLNLLDIVGFEKC